MTAKKRARYEIKEKGLGLKALMWENQIFIWLLNCIPNINEKCSNIGIRKKIQF